MGPHRATYDDLIDILLPSDQTTMNLNRSISLLALGVAVLSLSVGPAHANELSARERATAPIDQDLALADTSSADRPITDGLVKQRIVRWRVADGYRDDRSAADSTDATSNGLDIGNAPDPSEVQNERPWPERSTVADIHPALTGADSNDVEPETALGPQYRLNDNVTIGGTSEKPNLSAMTATPDADRYTFGLHITF